MRLYAVEDEVRLGLDRQLRDWTRAVPLSTEQARALHADLATTLRRTGPMLRLGLAAFTFIASAASVGFVLLVMDLDAELAVAVVTAVLGAASFATATMLVRRYQLYRHGVEEALAVGAVVLFGVSAALFGEELVGARSAGVTWSLVMASVALGSGAVYRRFGFQYAAVGALYVVAMLPMASGAVGGPFRRVFAALVCAAAYVQTTRLRARADDDVARADAEVVRAAAAAGAYLALNVVVTAAPFGPTDNGWFWWSTWVITWLLPVAVGRAAVRDRDPLLLRVAMATGLASLLTNKAYLGWPRHPWDPMLLGVVLVVVALGLRRWLAAGAEGERNGFTSRQLVEGDDAALQLAGLAAVTAQPGPTRDLPPPQDPTFSGGRSGGAGAGSTF